MPGTPTLRSDNWRNGPDRVFNRQAEFAACQAYLRPLASEVHYQEMITYVLMIRDDLRLILAHHLYHR